MGEQSAILPVPAFGEESPSVTHKPHICYLCQSTEGDHLFFHPTVKCWLHKRCFENYTCKNSPSKLIA